MRGLHNLSVQLPTANYDAMFAVVTSAKVFENLKVFKPIRNPVGVVNFIRISRHPVG